MKTTRLENWSVGFIGDQYTAPELRVSILQGNVYNHPNPARHPDGKSISTSPIIGKRNRKIVTKSGTEYHLGKVDPNYEKLFPGARARVFKNLPKI